MFLVTGPGKSQQAKPSGLTSKWSYVLGFMPTSLYRTTHQLAKLVRL